MSNLLSQNEINRYAHEGYLCPITVLSAQDAAHFRSEFEAVEQNEGSKLSYLGSPHLFFDWSWKLATHDTVLDAVEDILGPELLIHGTVVLCKYPGDASLVAWHQDGTYSGLYKAPSLSAWIALSDSTAANGCMQVIPQTHGQRLPHRKVQDRETMLGGADEVETPVDERLSRMLELQAGQMSLHHSNIIHGSLPNESATRRIGFVVRYVTPEIQQFHVPLVRARGQCDCSHLELLERRPSDDLEDSVGAWKEFNATRKDRDR